MKDHTTNTQPIETIGKKVKYIAACGKMHPMAADMLNWRTKDSKSPYGAIERAPLIGKILEYEVVLWCNTFDKAVI